MSNCTKKNNKTNSRESRRLLQPGLQESLELVLLVFLVQLHTLEPPELKLLVFWYSCAIWSLRVWNHYLFGTVSQFRALGEEAIMFLWNFHCWCLFILRHASRFNASIKPDTLHAKHSLLLISCASLLTFINDSKRIMSALWQWGFLSWFYIAGFRFGFHISDFRFEISDCRFQISDFIMQNSDLSFQMCASDF